MLYLQYNLLYIFTLVLNRCCATISIMKQRFGSFSLLFTASALPVSLLVGAIANYAYKNTNSKNLDLTSSSAYLREIVVAMVITFIIVELIGIVFSLISFKKSVQSDQAKLSLVVIAITLVLIAGASLVKQQTQKLEKVDQKERLNTFFNNLSK